MISARRTGRPKRGLFSCPKGTALNSKMKLRIKQTLLESSIRVNATIAQKRPVGAVPIDRRPVNLCSDDFFLIDAGFGDDVAVRAANETLSPKLDSISSGRFFMTHPVGRGNKTAVRDRMAALDCLPGSVLRFAEFVLLARMPADCGGIKQNFGTAQRGQARRFRIPLVPTNQDAERPTLCFPGCKAKIARREIKFLVVERIVRNVHLAIFA